MVAETAMQEDVDVVGLSILSGAHMELVPRIIAEMQKRGIVDLPVFLGGIIPEDDIPALQTMGVKAIFGPGTNTQTVIAFIRQMLSRTN
jgi:methylmalonyl-CoA mutase C-terminal domain/subunit